MKGIRKLYNSVNVSFYQVVQLVIMTQLKSLITGLEEKED